MVKDQGDKTASTKNFGILLAMKTNGQCSKGDNCSSRHDINKREVPEARVPVVECLDGPARITSKELAPIHSVKNGTLQNACSTSPRVVADLGKSALIRITRLMNSLTEGLKRMVTKVQWPC